MMRHRGFRFLWLVALAAVCGASLAADDGLWLFNRFPKELVAGKYGFQVTDQFLDHLRLASVRFNNGGSGSFISPDGLLFTNHHVGADCIQKLSSAQHDYMANGFYAATAGEERACPDLEINVLLRISDVTAEVTRSAPPDVPSAEANRLRKSAQARIEKECAAGTGNRCDVVTLYSGGEYHLYQYKKYTDIRLVLAPESDIAAFGGDPDNFTYPRYCLDFALFRAYENGRPARVGDYLAWSREGARDGELTFVSGSPGSTGRLATMAELEFARDVSYPLVQRRLASLVKTLLAYGDRSAENKRVAHENLLSQQNSYKAYTGFLAGLRDAELMRRKSEEERKLRAAVEEDPKKRQQFGSIWDEVAAAYAEYRKFQKPFWLLERAATRGSDLLAIARDVLRLAEERGKPDGQRLPEYSDAARASLEQSLYSTAPLSDSMEIAVLSDYFDFLRQELGAGDPTVKALLGGQTPRRAAEGYVKSSKLKDVAERKRLAASAEAARTSQDGMIRLARILDVPARQLRKQYEDRLEAVLAGSASKVARARFAVFGTNEYPDATFTLRLTYGPVIGYRDSAGRPVPYATRFEGLYARATGKEPFRLPRRWMQAKPLLDLKTPFNFVTTTDTHGGNSGSPTVNTKGEVIGILFDGNIESLPNRFVYTEEQARSVHVASQAIVEAMHKVYRAGRILEELGFPPR